MVWLVPPSVIVPALIRLCGVRFRVVLPPAVTPTVTLAPRLLVKVGELTDSVPVVTLSVPLLVNVFGLTVNVWPAVLAMMLPLLTRSAALLW